MKKQSISVTVDAVVFKKEKAQYFTLLIRRKNPPFQNQWALPGGFVENEEDLEAAAKRELKEETGIEISLCKQLYTFGKPQRDPRGRTISIAYVGFAKPSDQPKAADDAKEAKWFEIEKLPKLAFDHQEIINLAISRFLQDLP
ncbi:MAG: NUDIX hydrolase [Flavobacteriaceae bacterium]|nr:NUDIX hydrolase [Flavobacteriaceae bacterium]